MVVMTQCATQLWDLPICNVSFVTSLIYKYWNIKPTLVVGSTSSIQHWNIDVEPSLGSRCWSSIRMSMLDWPTLHHRWINKQNDVGPTLYCNVECINTIKIFAVWHWHQRNFLRNFEVRWTNNYFSIRINSTQLHDRCWVQSLKISFKWVFRKFAKC